MSALTGINWSIIKRYMKGNIYCVDLDILARICYVLDCPSSDIIYYEQIKNSKKEKKKSAQ